MSDAVAIAPELPFRQQISETLQLAARSTPVAEQQAVRDILTAFDQKAQGGEADDEAKRDIVRKVVDVYAQTKGALEAAKESEAESTHLLLQYVLASTFEPTSEEYAKLVKQVVEAVRVGGEAAAEAGRTTKAEAAARILNNTYNYLAATSPLRSTVLLALITLLGAFDDLATLTVTSASLSAALAQWSVSEADKVAFLTAASAVYEKAGDLDHAYILSLLALERSVDAKLVEHALALALAQSNRFDLDDLFKVQGTRDALQGKAAELVALFTSADEIEAVSQATTWTAANGPYVSGLGVAGLDADEVLRKVRLIALATLAARSATKQLAYADLAKALAVDESEVEAWVIDAIRADLLQARLSQPLSVVRIISVSSRATRRFGSEEWTLLERRLAEWKAAVTDARQVVDDAEAVAAQGPATHQRRPQQQRRQEKEQAAEEVAA
ncbi:Eukaryotic translation initiation factor 3 subunit M [Vanrija pseudolonga]|uniref:Eukaryotic translation initiation factor 3 subunit M n=1 Tax=Vanrija pseudolonga TaxID=143232 RepID=A0AAF0YEY5_9TREE|nr:Eukaryotic translation initiation factor 3 subunit M [Vanrija pseudolonga]